MLLRFIELTLKFRSLGASWATQERLVNENITVYAEQTGAFRTNDAFTLLQENSTRPDCLWFITAETSYVMPIAIAYVQYAILLNIS